MLNEEMLWEELGRAYARVAAWSRRTGVVDV
jgi:hypothetical protein